MNFLPNILRKEKLFELKNLALGLFIERTHNDVGFQGFDESQNVENEIVGLESG